MKRLIEYPLEAGGSILVEVNEDAFGVVPASPNDGVVKATQTFESALEKVRPVAQAILDKLKTGLSEAPNEIEVEFGLKMSAVAGVVVASATVEANYSVTLKWKRD